MLTRDQVIRRLCELQEEAAEVVGYDQPNDCFCGHGGLWDVPDYAADPSRYMNSGKALEFIEQAVRSAIAIHRLTAPTKEN